MPIDDSSKINLNALCADAPYLLLVDINYPTFTQPISLVSDVKDLTRADGTQYIGLPLSARLPSDTSRNPTAQLQVDNVGKILTQEIEKAKGISGGICRLRTVFRNEPEKVIQDYVMDVMSLDVNVAKVTLTLGYEDLLNRPAVQVQFRPETVPGLF